MRDIVFITTATLNRLSNMRQLLFLCLFPFCANANAATMFDVVHEVMKIDLPTLKNYETTTKDSSWESQKRIILKGQFKQTNVHLEIIKPEKLESTYLDTIKINTTIIKNLYGRSASPYPGDISRTQDCSSPDLQAKTYEVKKQDVVFSIIEGATNKRFVFGACLKQDVNYQGAIIIFKNNNSLATLKVFVPIQTYIKDKDFFKKFILNQ